MRRSRLAPTLLALASGAFATAFASACASGAGSGTGAGAPGPGADRDTLPYDSVACPWCAEWDRPAPATRIHGDSWYVGTRGLAAVLITSPDGHVLIDGGLPSSAPLIADNIRAAGFRLEDVRVIVGSHAHFDHAGGIAALQRLSGARALARPPARDALATGRVGPDDPQHAVHLDFPPVRDVGVVAEGDTVRVGPVAVVAHATAGHTAGGTSWSWRSCDADGCVEVVYADSLTPVSDDDFLFTDPSRYPEALADFEGAYRTLESLACDILVTPHPGASDLWDRLEGGEDAPPLVDPDGCRRYADSARARLARRVAEERGAGWPAPSP